MYSNAKDTWEISMCPLYVTEGTFNAYLWQTVENKQKFISQIMTSKSPVHFERNLKRCSGVTINGTGAFSVKEGFIWQPLD